MQHTARIERLIRSRSIGYLNSDGGCDRIPDLHVSLTFTSLRAQLPFLLACRWLKQDSQTAQVEKRTNKQAKNKTRLLFCKINREQVFSQRRQSVPSSNNFQTWSDHIISASCWHGISTWNPGFKVLQNDGLFMQFCATTAVHSQLSARLQGSVC